MYVTYRPEDGPEQRWVFDAKRVRASKAEMIEKRFGDTWESFIAAVQSGNMRARRVLLWHLLTLEHHGMRFEDTPDFFADELLVEHSVAELTEIRERVAKAQLAPDERDRLMAGLDLALAEAREREEAEGIGGVGKARSKSAENATP